MATNNEKRLVFRLEFDTESGTANLRGLDGRIAALKVPTSELRKEFGNFAKEIKVTRNELDAFIGKAKGQGGVGTGLQGVSKATGGATASALELGRVVSDMPYGIRGVANNLSQFASNMAFTAKQAGGLKNALKGLWASLAGPLGILLAVQAVIAAMEMLANRSNKTEKQLGKFAKESVTESAVKLKVLKKSLDDSNVSLERKQELINKANSEYKDLNLTLDNYEDKLNNQINLLFRTAKAQAVLTAITEEYKKQAEIIANGGTLEWYEQLGAIFTVGGMDATTQNAQLQAFIKSEEAIKKLMKLLEGNEDLLFGGDKGGKKAKDKRVKNFKQLLLDLSSELEAYRKKELANTKMSEEQRLRMEYDFAERSLEIKFQEFKDNEDARLDARLKEIEELKASEEEKAKLVEDAYTKYNDAQIQAHKDMAEVKLQMDIAYFAELSKLRRKDTEDVRKETEKIAELLQERTNDYLEFVGEQNISRQTNNLDRVEAEEKVQQEIFQSRIEMLEKSLLAAKGNAQRELEISNEIARVEHENALYQEELERRKRDAKIGIANEVADALIAIAGKGSGIAKGVAVAQTTWNTSTAVMNALGAPPYGPWNIAQAAAIALKGAAEVRNILATKAPHEKSAGGTGGAASSGTTFNPDFNIVGASSENQLAEAVAGQTNSPVQAYVVYDDIQTAGNLQSNAINSASI